MRFKIDWASLIVGSKCAIFCFVLLCFLGQFSKYKPSGGLYLEGQFNGFFFAVPDWGGGGGWGAYIWRGLYMEGLNYFRNNTVFQFLNFICILHLLWVISYAMHCRQCRDHDKSAYTYIGID